MRKRRRHAQRLGWAVWGMILLAPLYAAAQGTPPAGTTPVAPAKANTAPPLLSPDEVIHRFAAKESEFRRARDNYTYTQSFHVIEYDDRGNRGGEFQRTSDIVFTPEGKRFERITREPPSTLKTIGLTQEDIEDLANIQPFVLTSEDLGKYEVEYLRRERVDELSTYVFSVRPRRIERGQRYFEGTIWVDDQDFQIVKTYGKAVPDLRGHGQENLFPRFETYRENIDGKYWFPTYTRADDVLHFKDFNRRVRVIVRYTNYKQFKSSVRILSSEPVKPDAPPTPRPPQP